MMNLLSSFLKVVATTSDNDCEECDATSTEHNCMSCANDCQADCTITCDDSDTSGLTIGVCNTAGSGSSEIGCLYCYGSYSK